MSMHSHSVSKGDAMNRDSLVDKVIEQIKKDIDSGDTTALAELLRLSSLNWLESYLPEGDG